MAEGSPSGDVGEAVAGEMILTPDGLSFPKDPGGELVLRVLRPFLIYESIAQIL